MIETLKYFNEISQWVCIIIALIMSYRSMKIQKDFYKNFLAFTRKEYAQDEKDEANELNKNFRKNQK